MTNQELVNLIIEKLGGKDNILSATNCMTRLRIKVKDDSLFDEEALKANSEILGIVKDRDNYIEVVIGPGKVRKCADICKEMGIPAESGSQIGDWETNKANIKANQKESKFRNLLKIFGEIFIPLIPGVIAAGLCSGIATLITQVIPGYADNKILYILHQILTVINQSFLTYLTAWAGYRAAERFGGTPILGGMLGMITSLAGVDNISKAIGLFNEASPLDSILRSGRGGVLAVVLGVLVMVRIEKWVRNRMPDSLDIVFTPLLTLLITVIPYILIIMPLTGYVSTALVWVVQQLCMSENIFVRIISGFVASALFLPMVAMGMHHGLVALYTVQLNALGYVTLYPALAMAGAGQVGAAIALYLKAKKCGNTRIQNVIKGALPAGVLGVGEPLIYGVTLPMGKPFITAGLGAGFGGAFVMAMQVAATTWGPSGLLAIFVMTAGPNGAVMSMAYYIIGLVIAYIMGFIITNAIIKTEEVADV